MNYIELLDFWIPGRWCKIIKDNGSRIQGRLRHEAGAVLNKYTGKKVGGRMREEEKKKGLTLSIYESKLVVLNEIKDKLSAAEKKEQTRPKQNHDSYKQLNVLTYLKNKMPRL